MNYDPPTARPTPIFNTKDFPKKIPTSYPHLTTNRKS